jgi:uncharacterized protein YkwD
LFAALTIAGVACALLPSAAKLMGSNIAAAVTDAMNREDARLGTYGACDHAIELVSMMPDAPPQLEDRILILVNRERESAGVKPLSFSTELSHAARWHSWTMAQEGLFEHRIHGEPALFDRVTASGMDTDHVGENIFETSEGVSSSVADECVQMWMQSEGHRLNMLSPEFDKTGIAVGISQNGENYITEDFAH